MIDIAEKIIEQAEGKFAPEEFRDRYEESLRELIRRKEKGEAPTEVEPPPDTSNVVDLMEALRKSLSAKGKPAASSRAKSPSRTAKKRPRKSA